MAKSFIPYGRQIIDDEDIEAVISVLRSDLLTTGPAVEQFEDAICAFTGAKYGVAVNSGTAALHAAMFALNIGPGDEVIVSPMTFAATANSVLYQGGVPVFADVSADTLLVDPVCVEEVITPRTKAIIGVDYAGQPCDWDALRVIADKHDLHLVADACHSLGAEYKGRKVGKLADISAFSFHPVKNMTTGEGGMCTTDDENLAARMRVFRNHGITTTASQREESGAWFYEMQDLGYNYRITDFQCALGISQLKKLPEWTARRNDLAGQYDQLFTGTAVKPLIRLGERTHVFHLYVVTLSNRDEVFQKMRQAGIGVNVHYIPVYKHPYYQKIFGSHQELCPVAEEAYKNIITLPLWPGMNDDDLDKIICLLGD